MPSIRDLVEAIRTRDGVDAAVTNAVTQAAKTLRNLDWFEVTQIRGHLGTADGTVQHYQVTMKVGFRYE